MDKYEQRLQELGQMWKWTVSIHNLPNNLNLLDRIYSLEPYEKCYPNKFLVTEMQSDWCLYMENCFHGTDVLGQTRYLSKIWGVENISLYLIPEFGKDEVGVVMFYW